MFRVLGIKNPAEMTLDKMPADILLQVFSHLAIDEIARFSQANKSMYQLIKELFRKRYSIHYPIEYKRILNPDDPNINWYQKFHDAYYDEYIVEDKLLPLQIRRLHCFTKEGDLENIKKLQLGFKDLLMRSNYDDAIYIARRCNHQPILDYFFSLAVKEIKDKAELYKCAIATNQPVETLELIISQGKFAAIDSYNTESIFLKRPITLAVEYKNIAAINFLLEKKAPLDSLFDRAFSPLIFAMLQGDLQLVKSFLEKGADPNLSLYSWGKKIEDGDTPLHLAVRLGSVQMVQALLDTKKIEDRRHRYKTPLMIAIERDDKEIAKLLIKEMHKIDEYSESFGVTALLFATAAGNKEMVEMLLDEDADLSLPLKSQHYHTHFTLMRGDTPLHFAAKLGHLDILQKLHDADADINEKSETRTLLMSAAMGGHVEVVEFLLEQKIDINAKDEYGATALFFAVEYGHKEIVDRLIKAGAKTSAQLHYPQLLLSPFFEQYDPMFYFALSHGPDSVRAYLPNINAALYVRHHDLVRTLVGEAKAAIKRVGPNLVKRYSTKSGVKIGDTTLQTAVKLGRIEIVKTLLDSGEDINQLENERTPLMIAAEKGNAKMVELLVGRGASIAVRINKDTALTLATKRGNREIIKLLNFKVVTFLQEVKSKIKPLEKVDSPTVSFVANGQLLKILENIINELQKNNRTRNIFGCLFSLYIKNSELAERRTDIAKLLLEQLIIQRRMIEDSIPPANFTCEQYLKHKQVLYKAEQQVLHLLKQAQEINKKATKEFGRSIDGEGSLDALLAKSQEDISAYRTVNGITLAL